MKNDINRKKRAVILLSGGLDSATCLYIAKSKEYERYCLIFDYGQRHKKEIKYAKRLAERSESKYKLLKIHFPWKGSSLLDNKKKVRQSGVTPEIPDTYVPGRNTIFIAMALSYAETIKADAIFIGANCLDYSGYPDCRPEYFARYQSLMDVALHNTRVRIETPLLKKTKSEIIKTGVSLKVPHELTWSCYMGGEKPCGNCDACRLRKKGFEEAGLVDPLISREDE